MYYMFITLCPYYFLVIPPLASTVISPVSTTKLTYEDYKVFRSKYPGPYSNKSFVNWVAHGGKDRPLFRWPNLTPYSVPRARADKYENRGRSASRRKLEDRKDKSKYRDSTERRRSEGKESEESVYRERRQENRYRGRTEENRYQGGRKPSDYGGGRDRSIGGRSNGGIVNVYNCR
ncbi:uncharacterized protein LOC136078286 [Hydra vulgaris]|uniref:Uncharacterized protein LOC136078286 n=1 Tax=Hydra vulgaris TaxID=6087 RepID=A0ABM4BL91_HYDVU